MRVAVLAWTAQRLGGIEAYLSLVLPAMARAGLRVKLAYVPRWYWSQLGGPDLSGLTARKIGMVSSAYPGGSGTAAQLYPGDGAAGWQPYGSLTPLLYQFTNQASDGGQRIDMNACKSSAVALAAFLGTATPTPPSGGTTVAVLDHTDVTTIWGYSHGDSPDVHQTLANAAAWAGAANAKLDQLLGRPAPTVDVDALAAALGPHIAVTTDVGQLAADLAPHLPTAVDVTALATALVAHIQVTP